MNVLKKVFCRVFQAGMRIALPFLPYREPELIRGVGGVPAVLRAQRGFWLPAGKQKSPAPCGAGLFVCARERFSERGVTPRSR